jgi:co-chaperonin GroES (HSP10)
MTNIEPLGGLVLVKEIEQQDKKTASGLVLTASSQETELRRGTIIKVGPGERDQEGKIHSIPLEVGQIVIYNEGNATEVTDSIHEKYQFVNWRQLFGVENNG